MLISNLKGSLKSKAVDIQELLLQFQDSLTLHMGILFLYIAIIHYIMAPMVDTC